MGSWLPRTGWTCITGEGRWGDGRGEKPPSAPATCELGLGDHMKQSGERMRGGVRSRGRDEKGSGKLESSQLSPSCHCREEEEKDSLNWGMGPGVGGGDGLGRSGKGIVLCTEPEQD